MVICGQEFEFSLMNANDLDRFEDANERMQRRSAEESEQFRRGGIRLGDHARAQARIAMDCIDEELGNAFSAEKQRYAAKPSQPMNREQRRAAAKQQRKQKPESRSEGFHPQVASRLAQQPITQTNTFWPDTEAGTRRKTDQLIDARQAVNALRDDPDAMQQLAAYALQIAAERHV